MTATPCATVILADVLLSHCIIMYLSIICWATQLRQTDIYFIGRKKVITDLFVIEMRDIYMHMYIQDC